MDVLTLQEAAAVCRVHYLTMRRWAADGKVPSHRIGRRILVHRADLDQLLGGKTTHPVNAPTATSLDALERTLHEALRQVQALKGATA
jgi:excisionase family DNA binding protein